jgi:hypothetical protein
MHRDNSKEPLLSRRGSGDRSKASLPLYTPHLDDSPVRSSSNRSKATRFQSEDGPPSMDYGPPRMMDDFEGAKGYKSEGGSPNARQRTVSERSWSQGARESIGAVCSVHCMHYMSYKRLLW